MLTQPEVGLFATGLQEQYMPETSIGHSAGGKRLRVTVP